MLRDRERAIELYARAAELGSSQAHFQLGFIYDAEGNSKKEKFHYEAAAMAGHEGARYFLGGMEHKLGNSERAFKHWTIAASAGHHTAMHIMRISFKFRFVSRESIDSTLTRYNNSCAEMRSEARDDVIRVHVNEILSREILGSLFSSRSR